MRQLCTILMTLFALVAMTAPGVAAGLCTHGQVLPEAALAQSVPAPAMPSLPSPCETLGGKRLMPSGPVLDHRRFEIVGATGAQWARGLADQPVRHGRHPAMEPPPPRTA